MFPVIAATRCYCSLINLPIKPVCPPLHHFSAFVEILSMVVNSTHRTAVGMCQLHFNSISGPFVLVHNRAEFMPESVTAFQTLIADLFDHKQYRVLADWLFLIVAAGKNKL